MATLCARPTDCLASRAFFVAHRGVRAAPEPVPAPRRPMQEQESRIPGTAYPPVAARGRHRRRGFPPAAGVGSLPHKRVMENVVILKRGDPIPHVVAAALSAAGQSVAHAEGADAVTAAVLRGALAGTDERVAAAKQSSSEADKVETVTAAGQRDAKAKEAGIVAATVERGEQSKEKDEPVAFPGQSNAPAASAELAATADKRGPGTQTKKAGAAEHGATGAPSKAEPVAAPAHQTVLPRPRAKETERAPVATAGAATMAKQASPAAYASTSFAAAAPDPRELPIPVLLLKNRRRAAGTIRARVTDDVRAPVPTSSSRL